MDDVNYATLRLGKYFCALRPFVINNSDTPKYKLTSISWFQVTMTPDCQEAAINSPPILASCELIQKFLYNV
jgi:hypothetical protein